MMELPDEHEVRTNAVSDARQQIPSWEAEEFAPYIEELIQRAKHAIDDVMKRHHAECDSLRVARDAAERELAAARQGHAAADRKLGHARTEYSNAHGGKQPHLRPLRGFWYGLWLLLLFIFELPLNAVVFRIFGESEAMTLLFTVGISVVLLLCAHELGRMLRADRRQEPARQYFIPALIIFPILIIGGVAYAREQYIELLPAADYLRNPLLLYLAFAAINLTVIVAAAAISYGFHDPGLAQMEHAQREMRRAEERLARADARAGEVHELIENKRRDTLHGVERIRNEAEQRHAVYKKENLRARPDHLAVRPRSFERSLPLKLPAELLTPQGELPEEGEDDDQEGMAA